MQWNVFWRYQAITWTDVDLSLVGLHVHESNFTGSVQEFNQWHELENYTFKIIATSSRVQWVKTDHRAGLSTEICCKIFLAQYYSPCFIWTGFMIPVLMIHHCRCKSVVHISYAFHGVRRIYREIADIRRTCYVLCSKTYSSFGHVL